MSDVQEVSDNNFSGTVIKALNVLECLAQHGRPMSAQEVATACALSRPTAFRLLTTLMSRGFVRNDGHHNYALGTTLVSLGAVALRGINLSDLARPFLHELCLVSGETANLSILDGSDILYIGKEESLHAAHIPNFVQLRSAIGTRLTAHSSALGKAMLAHLSPDICHRLLSQAAPLRAYTAHTLTNIDALTDELAKIRQMGYAIDDREVDEGTRCVAAAVFDNTGAVVAAMSIAGPAYRLTVEQLHGFSKDVIRVTQALSHQLGYVHDNGWQQG